MMGTFFSEFGTAIGENGRFAMIVIAAVCLASAGIDIATWVNGGSLPFLSFYLVAIIPAYIGAIYLATLSILCRQPTLTGYLRFLGATVLTLTPFGVAIGSYLILGEQGVPILVVMVILGLAAVWMLPAWLTAQSISPVPLSPLRVLSATKGHRWGLIVGTSCVSAFNKFDMDVAAAGSGAEALLRGIGEAAIGTIAAATLAALTATAFRFAVRNDPGLDGTEHQRISRV